MDALRSDRASMLRADSMRSLVLILLAAGLIWAFINDKIKQAILIGGIGLLACGDLISVATRYINDDNYLSKREFDNYFKPSPADAQILRDPDPNYRL